jgi:FKBP-type peptidyl-prolyl cis-trans isomerase FkpA
MKKLFFLLFALPVILGSCSKSEGKQCAYAPPANIATSAEISYLQNYVTTNSIMATQHPSGVFYTVTHAGTGSIPTVCSNITVKYTGSVLGGNVFDSQTSANGVKFVLGSVILGWQTVLPVLNTGGSITLYIPPSLAYGATPVYDQYGHVVIPANSYLKFEIELLDVQ